MQHTNWMKPARGLTRWGALGLALLLTLAAAVGGFVTWGSAAAAPSAEALDALRSDAQVSVTSGDWLVFAPANSSPATGLIFYPGGRVDYRAYAPAARQIAAAGYLVIIPRMPLNLAVFDPAAAGEIIAAYPAVQHWAVGGHSLGGSMAANFARTHPQTVSGLVLWASYPADSDDLSASGLAVLSVSGSLDGLSTPDKIAATRPLLPEAARQVVIQGGNHAQFGWYGAQDGDNPAQIAHLDQQVQAVQATLELLGSLTPSPGGGE